jgi:hypothetical protein
MVREIEKRLKTIKSNMLFQRFIHLKESFKVWKAQCIKEVANGFCDRRRAFGSRVCAAGAAYS